MSYYIKDKETGDWCYFGYDEGYYDEDREDVCGGYWYLITEHFQYATEFASEGDALRAIWAAEGDKEDYRIVEVK